ncbi:MAG: fasciclin domain-containing protein [Myxococcota bacterium]|nr:fasciclin domain-containing protein [Myxococcota bacterium]
MKAIVNVSSLLLSAVPLCLMATACSSSDSSSATSPHGTAGGGMMVDAGSTPTSSKDIVDTAIANGNFRTLVGAVQSAGLEATLRGPGPLTVFAPTDAAFAKLPGFLVTKLVTPPYKSELGLILKYHVLPGLVMATDLLGKTSNPSTVEGGKLAVDGNGGKVIVNGSVNVTTPDVSAANGIIHVADGVLLPTIVDTAGGYDDGTTKFSTLVTAVRAADLVPTLSAAGTFTVFAPTDKAFADLKVALGDAAFNAILADKGKLQQILKYHLLASTVYAKDVSPGQVPTVEGNKLTLAVSGSDVTIADSTAAKAKIVLTDLPNSNGVIHVIDKVLLPPGI